MKNYFILIILFIVQFSEAMEKSECSEINRNTHTKSTSLIQKLPNELILRIAFHILRQSNNIENGLRNFENFTYFIEKLQNHEALKDKKFSEDQAHLFTKYGWNSFAFAKKLTEHSSSNLKKESLNNLIEKYGYTQKEFNEWLCINSKNFIDLRFINNYFFDLCYHQLKKPLIKNKGPSFIFLKKEFLFNFLFLIKIGSDPNSKSLDGKTILMIASGFDDIDLVKLLIEGGADPNIQDQDGFTAYTFALTIGCKNVCQFLLNSGAIIDKQIRSPALVKAVIKSNIQEIKVLLNLKADANSETDEKALCEAVKHRHHDIAKLLLDSGANPNTRFTDGETVLMKATDLGQIDMVNLLLQAKADPNIKNTKGWTALTFAICKKHTAIIKVLICASKRTKSLIPFITLPNECLKCLFD